MAIPRGIRRHPIVHHPKPIVPKRLAVPVKPRLAAAPPNGRNLRSALNLRGALNRIALQRRVAAPLARPAAAPLRNFAGLTAPAIVPVKKPAGFLQRGLQSVGGIFRRGAQAVGGVVQRGTQSIGGVVRRAVPAIGGAIARNMQGIGHGLGMVGRGIGHGIATVARGVGHGIAVATRAVGRAVAVTGRAIGRAVRATGHALARAGRAIGRGIAAAGRGIARAVRAVGHGITKAGRAVGTALATAGRKIADAVSGKNLTNRQDQGLTFSESKNAANLAYEAWQGQTYTLPDGRSWTVTSVREDSATGFRAIVMKPTDPNDHRSIIAYAGSEFSINPDWKSNFEQQIGGVPIQYQQALQFARDYQRDNPGANPTLTGHSLGGGLSSYVAIQTGLRATAINSAPLASGTLGGNPLTNPNVANRPNITQYVQRNEILGQEDDINPTDARPGNHVVVPGRFPSGTGIIGSGLNHMMSNTAPGVQMVEPYK